MRLSFGFSFLAFFFYAAASLAGSWSDAAPLQNARAALGADVLDGRIYAVGGAGLLAPLDTVETYQSGGGWRADQALPVGLEQFGLAASGGLLYAAGGYAAQGNGEVSNSMWVFDPKIDEWTITQPMPTARASFVFVALHGRLYALGGSGPQADRMAIYDTRAGEWTPGGITPVGQRRGASAVVLDSKIYVIAGGEADNPGAQVDVYDPASGKWSTAPDIPVARSGHTAAVLHGKIHVFGGRSGGRGETLNDHWVFDPQTAKWMAAEPMPAPRTGAAAVSYNDAIYLLGGGSGGGFFAPFTAIASTLIWRPGPGQ